MERTLKKERVSPFKELLYTLLFFGSIATVFGFNVLHIIDNIDGYTKAILSGSCILIELIFLYTYKEKASVKTFVSFLILFLPVRNIIFYTTSYDIYYLFLVFFILFFIGSLAVEIFGLKKSGYFDRANENYEDYSQHETILDDWKFDQPFGKYAWTTQTGIYE